MNIRKKRAALLCAVLLLGACAPQQATPLGGEPSSSAAIEDAYSASEEQPVPKEETEQGADALAGARELQPAVGKIVPGCRNTLAYPLKMHGESAATDFTHWTAQGLDGSEVTQDILKESRLTLVNVWATFCGGHIEDLELLQKLYEEYSREDLNVVGILASAQRPDGSVNEDEIGYVEYLLDMTGAKYPQLLPSDDLIQIRLKDLGIIPQSFLLDSEGNQVGDAWTGSRTEEELRRMIDAALQQ